jgi:hypothetical protein
MSTKNLKHGLVYSSCDPNTIIDQFVVNPFTTAEKYGREDVS